MSDTIEWIAVEQLNKLIGSVGFIGNNAVSLVTCYEDADANKDGRVDWGEMLGSKVSFNLRGVAVTEVAMQARYEPEIMCRDPSFNQLAVSMFATLAQGLIAQGIYQAYFAQGVSLIGSGLASMLTAGMIKEFLIRKGFETAVKMAFMKAAGVRTPAFPAR